MGTVILPDVAPRSGNGKSESRHVAVEADRAVQATRQQKLPVGVVHRGLDQVCLSAPDNDICLQNNPL